MKKLAIAILFSVLVSVAWSQNYPVKTLATITNLKVARSYTFTTIDNYMWIVQFSWTKNDDSTTVWITQSLDSTNWVLYPFNINNEDDSVTFVTATGSTMFEDDRTLPRHIRVNLLPTDSLTGTLKYILKRR